VGALSDLAQRAEAAWGTLREFTELPARMTAAEERIDTMSENQDYLNHVTDVLGQYQTAIQAEIDDLKAQAEEGRELDFTRLDGVTAGFAAMVPTVSDPSTPVEPPATDPEQGDPVDSTPVDLPSPVDPGPADEGDARLV
jgi:hypothetical protein